MSETKALQRIETIAKKIGFIQEIVEEYGSVSDALADEAKGRAAILMHLTSIAEQFDKQDIKGSYDLRNFIAHDCEGVDLFIVEDVVTDRLPVILEATRKILKNL